jgi:hypothetical protein
LAFSLYPDQTMGVPLLLFLAASFMINPEISEDVGRYKRKPFKPDHLRGHQMELGKRMNSYAPVTVLFTNGIFLTVLVVITVLAGHVASSASDTDALWINVLVSLIGGLCGWIVGTGLAPYSPQELKRFRDISVTASAFLSGYVVSKLDRLLDATLLQNPTDHAIAWERAGLFIAAFLATAITVFINRFYSPPIKMEDEIGGGEEDKKGR